MTHVGHIPFMNLVEFPAKNKKATPHKEAAFLGLFKVECSTLFLSIVLFHR